MDGTSPDKLGFKGRMSIFTALEKTYGRECAHDIATKSDGHVLNATAALVSSTQRRDQPRSVLARRASELRLVASGEVGKVRESKRESDVADGTR
jgi:hypothetical protein